VIAATRRAVIVRPRVTTVLHLSDLHLLSGDPDGEPIRDSLLGALAEERRLRGPVDLVVITGDLFDSGDVPTARAVAAWSALHEAMQRVLGAPPTVLVPGNHDRRRMGLFGPHSEDLFRALGQSAGRELFVHGNRAPFLAAEVPRSLHRQPLDVVAYDSTQVVHGHLSAGGVVRSEDILEVAAGLPDEIAPLLFLLHHHLVPTPLTDVGPIEARRLGPVARWLLHDALPKLVSHADREELTMTALGAGTALSTLHELGRPVVVLHGHKHVATARKLEGTRSRHGDVIVISGGSAGSSQSWTVGDVPDAARLWPSFNVLELEEDAALSTLSVDQVSFGYKGRSSATVVRRTLLEAERDGARWHLLPFASEERFSGRAAPHLAENRAAVRLCRSSRPGRLDGTVKRSLVRGHPKRPHRYVESIEGLPGATLVHEGLPREIPAQLALPIGRESRYELVGGLPRSLAALGGRGARDGGAPVPFGAVKLVNRYASATAVLELAASEVDGRRVFASATDLGTGEERPLRLAARDRERAVVELSPCPARTLIQLHWPLAAH
jgi:metallophosphoesterase superfamily enzyme